MMPGSPVGRPVLGDEAKQVFPGASAAAEFGFGGWGGELRRAAVDGDRLARRGSNLHLRDEAACCVGNRVFEVVVVEADLADGEAARVGGERRKFCEILGGGLVRFLRMDAGGGANLRVRPRQVERAVHRVRPVADADGEQLPHAGFACMRKDRRKIFVVVEMAVRVDQHKGSG